MICKVFVFHTLMLAISNVNASNMKRALVFGGNGFIGSETVVSLFQANFHVTCISRGNWHWDTKERIKPLITHIACDRKQGLQHCAEFLNLIENKVNFDLVVDFSGYKPETVEASSSLLKGLAKLYVYISTDSVYEVAIPQLHAGPSREQDARRPDAGSEREKLKRMDSYGHYKLACEEVLQTQWEQGGIPFVIIRLPDVIGPRDSTNRWWPYQMWIQFYNAVGRRIPVPQHVQALTTSYVYVSDVANLITLLFDKFDVVKNQIFNVALDKELTLVELLTGIQTSLAAEANVQFNYDADPSSFSMFPSVTRGGINISKIKDTLQWSPTPWDEAIKRTVEFYRTALYKFPAERAAAVETLMEYVIPSTNKHTFLKAVENEMEVQQGQNMQHRTPNIPHPPKRQRTDL